MVAWIVNGEAGRKKDIKKVKMIGYMEGNVLRIAEEGILMLVGGVGYEIVLPLFVLENIKKHPPEETVSLFIYYNQTERQPRPVLIGFESEMEKAFFQLFISVDAIGPLKAVKAMDRPVSDIARAIENRDEKMLATLKGIGKRTAQKIIAALHGKVSGFVKHAPGEGAGDAPEMPVQEGGGISDQVSAQVVDVLVHQLGYVAPIARKMVNLAIAEAPDMSTPEELFDAVIRRAGS